MPPQRNSFRTETRWSSFILLAERIVIQIQFPLAEIQSWQAAGFIHWDGAVQDVRPAIAAAHVYVLPMLPRGDAAQRARGDGNGAANHYHLCARLP